MHIKWIVNNTVRLAFCVWTIHPFPSVPFALGFTFFSRLAEFLGFFQDLVFYWFDAFSQRFVEIWIINITHQLLAVIIAVDAHMIGFITFLVQPDMERKFVIGNFDQFLEHIMNVCWNCFRLTHVLKVRWSDIASLAGVLRGDRKTSEFRHRPLWKL